MENEQEKISNEIKKDLIWYYRVMGFSCALMTSIAYITLVIQYYSDKNFVNIILLTILMILSAVLGYLNRKMDIF